MPQTARFSKRVGVGFPSADANRAFNRRHKDLAVSDLSGLCGIADRLDDPVCFVGRDGNFTSTRV